MDKPKIDICNQMINEMTVIFAAKSSNEGLARSVVAAFASQLDPTIEELADVRTAVSEAVTNSIIHAYGNSVRQDSFYEIKMTCKLYSNRLDIIIVDYGKGIEDIKKAREPLFTTSPETERSGMGFTVMEAFMDKLEINSIIGEGTTVSMSKIFNSLLQR